MRMKICFWISSLFTAGGTKKVVTMIANELVKSNAVSVITYDDPEMENRERYGLSENIKIHYMKRHQFRKINPVHKALCRALVFIGQRSRILDKAVFRNLQKNVYYPSSELRLLAAYLNEFDFDIIIGIAENALTLAILTEQLNARAIGWLHNSYEAYFEKRFHLFWHKENLLRQYAPCLDALLVLNPYIKKDYLEKLHIETTVIGNPKSFVCEEKNGGREHCFFAAVRFVKEKGIDLMLQAFALYCQKESSLSDRWKLVIAGDGEEMEMAVSLAKQLGISDWVVFPGMIDHIEDYYQHAGIYLMTSRYEGWGLVVIEAFEAGVPVIAFDIEPMDQLISQGEDGLIIPSFDVDAFAAAMYRLASNEEERLLMHQNAVRKADQFSIEQIMRQWNQLLENKTGVLK